MLSLTPSKDMRSACPKTGMSISSIDYILTTIKTSTTTVKLMGSTLVPVKSGFKQGDPISELNSDPNIGGVIAPSTKTAALAFADDMVFIENKEETITVTLKRIL